MSDEIFDGVPIERWRQMGANWNDDRMYEMGRRHRERESELEALRNAQIDLDRKLVREDLELREVVIREPDSTDERLANEEKQREEFLETLERQRDWPSKAEEEGLHGQ